MVAVKEDKRPVLVLSFLFPDPAHRREGSFVASQAQQLARKTGVIAEVVLDLVGVEELRLGKRQYAGICW